MLIHPDEEFRMRRMRLYEVYAMAVVFGETVVLGVHFEAALGQRELHFEARLTMVLQVVVPENFDGLVHARFYVVAAQTAIVQILVQVDVVRVVRVEIVVVRARLIATLFGLAAVCVVKSDFGDGVRFLS